MTLGVNDAQGHVGEGCVREGCAGQGGHVWQETQPLQQAVHILLECILVLPIFCCINSDANVMLCVQYTGCCHATYYLQ